MKIAKLKIDMHCATCAINVDKVVNKLESCKAISNPVFKITEVEYDETKTSLKKIIKAIKGIGYNATEI